MISIAHFKNILHNFGFYRLTKREIDDEMRRADIDFPRRNCVDLTFCKHVIAYRWNKGGNVEEAKECFMLFDKNCEKANHTTILQVLNKQAELGFTVDKEEVHELMMEVDPNYTGGDHQTISAKAFIKLYNS